MGQHSVEVKEAIHNTVDKIRGQLLSRGIRAANELRKAEVLVLRGRRSGRVYGVPNTKRHYTASAPGEPPAVRTGAYRDSWQPRAEIEGDTVKAIIESKITVGKKRYVLGELLENGTSRMAPRPHSDRILEKALPNVKRIYKEPYE